MLWTRSALLLILAASPGLCLPQSFWRRSFTNQPPTPTSSTEISTARQDRCPASRGPPKTRTITNYISTSVELKELSFKPANLPETALSEAGVPEEDVTVTVNGTLTRHKIMFPTATEVHTVSYNYTALLTSAKTIITEISSVTTYTATYWDVTDVEYPEKSSVDSKSAGSDNAFSLVTTTSSPAPTGVHSSTAEPHKRIITWTYWHSSPAASILELSAKPPDPGPIVTLTVNKTKTYQLYQYPISTNTDDVGTRAIEELTGPTGPYSYTYTHLPVTNTYYTTEESYPWLDDTATAPPGATTTLDSTLKTNDLKKRTHRVLLNDESNEPDHLPSSLVDLSLGTYTTPDSETPHVTQTVHQPVYTDGSMTTLDYRPTYFPDTTVTVNNTYSWDGVVYPQKVIVSTLLSTVTRADTLTATTISTISTLQSIQTITQWDTISWIHVEPVPTVAPGSSPDPVQSGVLRLTTWLTEIVTTIYTSALPTNAPTSVDLVYKTVSLAVYKVPGGAETIPAGVLTKTWPGGSHTGSLASAAILTYYTDYTDIYRPETTTADIVTATVTESKRWALSRPLEPRQEDALPDDTCSTAATTAAIIPDPAAGMTVTQTAYAVKSTYTVTSIPSFTPQWTTTTVADTQALIEVDFVTAMTLLDSGSWALWDHEGRETTVYLTEPSAWEDKSVTYRRAWLTAAGPGLTQDNGSGASALPTSSAGAAGTTNETFVPGFPSHYVVPRPSKVGESGTATTSSRSSVASHRPSPLTDSRTRTASWEANATTMTKPTGGVLPVRLFTNGSHGVDSTTTASSSMVTANFTLDPYPVGHRPTDKFATHTDRVVYRTTTTTLVTCPERMNTTTHPPL